MTVMTIWLVVWNMKFMTFHILGISWSQLTFSPSFFRGVGQPPTSYIFLSMVSNIYPIMVKHITIYNITIATSIYLSIYGRWSTNQMILPSYNYHIPYDHHITIILPSYYQLYFLFKCNNWRADGPMAVAPQGVDCVDLQCRVSAAAVDLCLWRKIHLAIGEHWGTSLDGKP